MITSVFLNLIYILMPILCYFLYLVSTKTTYKKENQLFLDLALLSSFFLCYRFETLPIEFSFLINIPLLIAMYKKRVISSVILSLLTATFLAGIYDVNIYAFIIQYVIIFALCYATSLKEINVFIIIKILFGMVISIFLPNRFLSVDKLIYMLILLLFMYAVFYLVIELYSRLEKLVNMYHSLEEITREKTLYQSLFKITHEIKNPLAVCKGYLEMFDINNVGKANKYIGIIDQEIDRTLTLLKDFSDVSKISVDKNNMDIGLLVEDTCDEAKMIFNGNVDFKYELCDKEAFINGDYNRLKQVLINAIKNAKEAIEKDGVVNLSAKISKDKYIIRIKDNGRGMNKETKSKIGTPFYTTKKDGTGLGVCFSKEIIEKHNGIMEYSSKQNEGTTVKIILPIEKVTTS